jgi:eukaryotic-like serine/threonine-protein kinase
MEENKVLVEQWGKPNKRVLFRLKISRYFWISLFSVAVVVIAFLVFFNTTDLIVKPSVNVISNSGPGEWAMFGHDPIHSGSAVAQASLPQGSVTELLATGDEMRSSPAVAYGMVYIGSRDYNLYAIDESTGAIRWKFKAGSYIDASPVIANNTVYFGSNDGNLYALNAATGQKVWTFSTQYAIRSAPAISDGRLYFGGDDYCVRALDAATGKQIWSYETGNCIQSSPVVANGIVYAGSWDENFYALDARNGKTRLQFPAGNSISAAPVVIGTTVYVGNSGSYLYAIDGNARNWWGESRLRPIWESLHIYNLLGKPPTLSGYLWSLKVNGKITSSPAVAGNKLYIGVGNKLVAVDIQNKTQLWEFKTGDIISSMPAAINGRVYIPSQDGHFYIVNGETGEQISDIPVGSKLTSAPAVSGSTVFVSSADGKLFAIR